MSNKNHEILLISSFRRVLEKNNYINENVKSNFGRNNNTLADVEFLSCENEYLVIEAKSHKSRDIYNTHHKIFGELLKETGKSSSLRTQYSNRIFLGILIPIDKGSNKKFGKDFYRTQFNFIPRDIFIGYGKLVNAKYVFACSEKTARVELFTWEDFYDNKKPIKVFR